MAINSAARAAFVPAAITLMAVSTVSQPPVSEDAGIKLTYAIVDCLMQKPNQLRQTLAYLPRSAEAERLFTAARPARCMPNPDDGPLEFRIPAPYFRGAVAESMLRSDFSAIGVAKQKPAAVFVMPLSSVIEPGAPPERAADRRILTTLECAVRAAPAQAYAVFATPLRSPEERAAVTALAPVLSGCLVQGQQFAMKTSPLRAYLAEAAYRVSADMAATQPQASR